MADFPLLRCNSLDSALGCCKEMTVAPTGPMPAHPEPSEAEVAQCAAEVGTLLSFIAEVNKKMGALKAPSEAEDIDPPSEPQVLDRLTYMLVSSRPERRSSVGITSKPLAADRGASSRLWLKLQQILSAVEDSIRKRRAWAVRVNASDREKQTEHLAAAHDSSLRSTKLLEEMESVFGISCSYVGVTPDQDKQGCHLRSPPLTPREGSRGTEEPGVPEEGQGNSPQLESLQTGWRSGSFSSAYSPPGSPNGVLTPDCASPAFPGSPFLHRRCTASSGSASPVPNETEKLRRCIRKLQARKQRLTVTLKHRRGGSLDDVGANLEHEADSCEALQMALRYCEQCEEACSELLSLYEAKEQQHVLPWTSSAEPANGRQEPSSPVPRTPAAEELSTSFSAAGGDVETVPNSPKERIPDSTFDGQFVVREAALRRQIERLKRERRTAVRLPGGAPRGAAHTGPESPALPAAGDTRGAVADTLSDLVAVKEKASMLRGERQPREREHDLGLEAQEETQEETQEEAQEDAQEEAHRAPSAVSSGRPRAEREDRVTEAQVGQHLLLSPWRPEERAGDQERLAGNAAELAGVGGIGALEELQAVLHRDHALKRRLTLVRDSLIVALSDSASRRKGEVEHLARLVPAHSDALTSYWNVRRRYKERVKRLEKKMAAMSETHQNQIGALKASLAALESRREETVL